MMDNFRSAWWLDRPTMIWLAMGSLGDTAAGQNLADGLEHGLAAVPPANPGVGHQW